MPARMRPFHRHLLLLLALLAVLLAIRPAIAKDREGAVYQFEFNTKGEGLSFNLPDGWKSVVDDMATVPRPQISFEKPDMPKLLFYATPKDSARASSLAVLRQFSLSPVLGPQALPDMLQNLYEIAAQQGHVVTSSEVRGDPSTIPNALLAKVTAEREGNIRTFTLIALNRSQEAGVRCYWRSDSNDPKAASDYNEWFKSLKFKDSPLSSLLSPASQDPAGEKTAAVATPASTAPSSPQPSETLSEKVQSIVSEFSGALVVIEGDNGTGSGFLCNFNGEPSLLTNAHVLAGNPNPTFRTIDDQTIPMGPAYLAVGHDICRISAPSASAKLEIMANVDKDAKVGDRVTVLGNAEGGGVVTPFEGRIVGIGPNLVEVDAPFVPGNSGSPIIHLDSGKVIGIATYILIRKVEGGSGVTTKERRFGYRLDKIKEWQPVNWPLFYRQSAQVAQLRKTGEEFVTLFTNANEDRRLIPAEYSYSRIRSALETFQRRAGGNRLSQADAQSAYRDLLGNLRIASQADIATFDSRSAYDYFRREVETEAKFRKEIYDALTRALD